MVNSPPMDSRFTESPLLPLGLTRRRPSSPFAAASQHAKILLAALAFALSPAPLQAQSTPPAQGPWIGGITEAIHDASLSSAVIGIVRSRPLQEGARVKQGDLLLELDNRLEEIEVTRKRLIRDHARTDLERARSLAAKSTASITQEEIEKKQAEFDVASADFDFATEQLQRRRIVAPFDGVVVEYYLKAGEGCQALQPLVRLVDPSKCWLVVSVDEKVGHDLKAGAKLPLEIDAGKQATSLTGTIDFVAPVADPASGLMKVKVAFDNPDSLVRPGVAGRLKLPASADAK